MELFFGAFTTDWERKRAAFLHDLSLGKRKPVEEEERRRRSGAAGGEMGALGKSFAWSRNAGPKVARGSVGSSGRTMKERFAGVATGCQPAVVKMASFGSGGRLGAMVNYVSRNGEVTVENERGEELRGRDALSSIGTDWDHLMKNRAESRDIGSFRIEVETKVDESDHLHNLGREIIRWSVGDRSFAFAISPRVDGGGYDIEGQVVLRSPGGERLTGDTKASEIVQSRLDEARTLQEAGEGPEGSIRFRFTGYGNGTDYGSSRLRALVEKHDGRVEDEKGRSISDAKTAGDLIQKEWREQLLSRKPRDVMHLILSARAGTDVTAFHSAAREFLAAEFGGHRYVFSIHDQASDPKPEQAGGKRPHIHVHAIVAMRSEFGDRLEITIPSFRHWREIMAEKARAQGIKMEMTDRRERASAPAYSRGQVRPISTIGRTEHEGTSDAGQRRYDAKRVDERSFARTDRSRAYTESVRKEWEKLLEEKQNQAVISFAKSQLSRLAEKELNVNERQSFDGSSDGSPSQHRTNMVMLVKTVSEGDEMRQMSRSEFEAYEKRVETALFQAERTTQDDWRSDFNEIANAARDHVNVHRELMEMREQDNDQPVRQETVPLDQNQDHDHDDVSKQWDEAVSRHGLQTVEAANNIMLRVEYARERIEVADAEDIKADREALEANLKAHMTRAADLGAAGNGLIREIAEVDAELRLAIEAAESSRDRGGSNHQSGSVLPSLREDMGGSPGAESEVATDEKRGELGRSTGNGPSPREKSVSSEMGDTTRSDPAKQHLPRFDELQREADETEERDRDDRDR